MYCFTLWAQRCHDVESPPPPPPHWVSVSSLQAFDISGNMLFLSLPTISLLSASYGLVWKNFNMDINQWGVFVSSLNKGENSCSGSVWRYKHPHTSKAEFKNLNNISCLFRTYSNFSVWAVSYIFRWAGGSCGSGGNEVVHHPPNFH